MRRGHKTITQTSKARKTLYQKFIKISARVGYTPPAWKRAQVQGLKESRQTIRGDDVQALVSCIVPIALLVRVQ